MDLQKFIDHMGAMDRETRASYHLTLGQAIEFLSNLNADLPIIFDWNKLHPDDTHSYRGYYADLAIDWTTAPYTVKDFKNKLKQSLNKTFIGYKGGEFTMDKNTPLWAAQYGACGRAIINIYASGDDVVLVTKQVD